MKHIRRSTSALLVLACAAPAGAQSVPSHGSVASIPEAPAGAIDFDAIRAATEKYRDVKAAIADGYILPMPMCVDAVLEGYPAQLGAMGLHYVRPDLLGITAVEPRVNGTGTNTDFLRPSILIYEPQPDGSERLVAIENLVWAKAWKEAGNTRAPSFHGQEYYYMHDNAATEVDEAHDFEPHWELHMWLYKDNPAGMFSPFNAAVTCANHRGG